MAESKDERAKRLREAPIYSGEGIVQDAMRMEHMTYSLWRIAGALEQMNLNIDRIATAAEFTAMSQPDDEPPPKARKKK